MVLWKVLKSTQKIAITTLYSTAITQRHDCTTTKYIIILIIPTINGTQFSCMEGKLYQKFCLKWIQAIFFKIILSLSLESRTNSGGPTDMIKCA